MFRHTLCSFGLLLPTVAAASPDTMAYGGRLLDSAGEALNGSVTVRIELHDHPTNESEVWFEEHAVTLVDGYFHVDLGSNTALTPVLRTGDSLWVQTEVGNVAVGPRTALNAAPYAIAGGGGGLVSMQSFTSSGTWVRPAGVTRIEVIVTGGGGGGGSHNSDDAHGGGGAGGTAIEIIDVSNVISVPVTVGSGGAGSCGDSRNGGSGGGTSSFGTYLSATGGQPPSDWGAGGVGGMGQGGDLNLRGNDGDTGNIDGSGNSEAGGNGGASYWGGSASGGTNWLQRRDGFHGSGGGGTHVNSNNCGGAGGAGLVVVREYGR